MQRCGGALQQAGIRGKRAELLRDVGDGPEVAAQRYAFLGELREQAVTPGEPARRQAFLREACAGDEFDVVVVNFANGDMVGHTGIYEAAVAAVRTLDRLLGEVMPPSLARGTTWLVTADHGNCDEMLGPDGEVS